MGESPEYRYFMKWLLLYAISIMTRMLTLFSPRDSWSRTCPTYWANKAPLWPQPSDTDKIGVPQGKYEDTTLTLRCFPRGFWFWRLSCYTFTSCIINRFPQEKYPLPNSVWQNSLGRTLVTPLACHPPPRGVIYPFPTELWPSTCFSPLKASHPSTAPTLQRMTWPLLQRPIWKWQNRRKRNDRDTKWQKQMETGSHRDRSAWDRNRRPRHTHMDNLTKEKTQRNKQWQKKDEKERELSAVTDTAKDMTWLRYEDSFETVATSSGVSLQG